MTLKIVKAVSEMQNLKKRILFTREEIDERVKQLASQISEDYQGCEIIIIGVLKGAFIFVADLIRNLSIPCKIDFARVASYGTATISSGCIDMKKNIEMPIKDKDVIVVEDIVDTGLTLSYLVDQFKKELPRSLKVCAFIDKRKKRKVPFEADYVGFTIDDGFIVGYGLDADEKARFLPDIYIIDE